MIEDIKIYAPKNQKYWIEGSTERWKYTGSYLKYSNNKESKCEKCDKELKKDEWIYLVSNDKQRATVCVECLPSEVRKDIDAIDKINISCNQMIKVL